MKIVFFLTLTSLGFWAQKVCAQTTQTASGFYALNLLQQKMEKKRRRKMTNDPFSLSSAGKCYALPNDRWQFGTDVAYNKNTINYDASQGSLLETIHTYAPVYVNYFMVQDLFLECGGYFGLLANSADVSKSEVVQISDLGNTEVGFDSGLIAGFGVRLRNFGNIKLRYNHGISRIVPLDSRTTVKNRMVHLGLTLNL